MRMGPSPVPHRAEGRREASRDMSHDAIIASVHGGADPLRVRLRGVRRVADQRPGLPHAAGARRGTPLVAVPHMWARAHVAREHSGLRLDPSWGGKCRFCKAKISPEYPLGRGVRGLRVRRVVRPLVRRARLCGRRTLLDWTAIRPRMGGERVRQDLARVHRPAVPGQFVDRDDDHRCSDLHDSARPGLDADNRRPPGPPVECRGAPPQ